RRTAPDGDAAGPGILVWDIKLIEVIRQQLVKRRPLGREECHECIVCRLSNRRLDRSVGMRTRDAGIAFVSAGNGVDRIEDRDLYNRDCPAGSAGSELLVEHPVL